MIKEIVSILNRRRQQIVITFVAIVAAVVIATLLMPKQYETRMKILVKSERANDSSAEVSETQVNTEIELLTSNNLVEQVVKSTNLQRLEKTSSSIAPRDRDAVAIETAVMRLQKALKITAVRKANIIEVKYSASNPHTAALVLREFAEKYLAEHLKAHSSPGAYDFFAGQAARYKEQLMTLELALAKFREQGNIVLLAQQKEAILQKSLESKSALLQAQASIGEYQGKIAHTSGQLTSVDNRVVTQSRVVPNQYLVERLNTMMAELQNKRTLLLTKFRPDDRSVREVDQEIADTQSALDKAAKQTGIEQTTDVNPVRQSLEIEMAKDNADLAGLQAKQRALGSQEQDYRSQLMKLDSSTAPYDDLVREQKEVEENYLLYSKKSEEARIAESLDQQKIANVTLVETPTEPHLPSKPNVPMNIALGTVLAACVSLGIALCAEYYQRVPNPSRPLGLPALEAGDYPAVAGQRYLLSTITGPADLEELTGIPVLALLDGR